MKIQTVLRLQSEMYQNIKEMAQRSGVSINSLIVILIEMGMKSYAGIGKEKVKNNN